MYKKISIVPGFEYLINKKLKLGNMWAIQAFFLSFFQFFSPIKSSDLFDFARNNRLALYVTGPGDDSIEKDGQE